MTDSSAAVSEAPPLLELRGISKHFGGVTALQRVSLRIFPGEVVALVGDNGAGKSTMVKIMSGVLFPDEGEIRHLGRIVTLRDARDAAAIGVQTVYQDLALCNNLGTIQNLFLGREIARPWYRGGRLIMAAMESRARQVLGELGVVIPDLGVAVGSLSGGQRQSNAICRAVLWDARVVILDEPTAALGVKQRRQVLEVVKRLRAENIGVVVVSHDLVEVRSIADRVVVLRLGRNVAEMRASDATHEAIVAAITGGGGDPAAPAPGSSR